MSHSLSFRFHRSSNATPIVSYHETSRIPAWHRLARKKNGTRGGGEKEKYREKPCTCLIWSHVSRQINVGSSRDQVWRRSHCAFYCSRDGSLIWDPPHAWEREGEETPNGHCPRGAFDAYDAALDILFIPSSPPAHREKSPWKKLRRFLEIADSQAIISVRRVRFGHGWRVHCPLSYIGRISSLLPVPFPPSFLSFCALLLSRRYPLSLPLLLMARSQWLRLRGPRREKPGLNEDLKPGPEEREAGSPSLR